MWVFTTDFVGNTHNFLQGKVKAGVLPGPGTGTGAAGHEAPGGGAMPPAGPRQRFRMGAATPHRGGVPPAHAAPAGGARPAQRPARDPAGREAAAGSAPLPRGPGGTRPGPR